MKRWLTLLLLALPLVSLAGDYQSSLVVQTGKFRESDLIVRTITDLESNKICLAFYVRTAGTSPMMNCYEARSGFRSNINQVGHFKEGKLVVRKLKDHVNDVACLVAYVSTEGTSPTIDCYRSAAGAKDAIVNSGHVREGDLSVRRIVDKDSGKTCLIAHVSTTSTAPSLTCYDSHEFGKAGIMVQSGQLREGDLVVRKITDKAAQKSCLITYVSTKGTSPHLYCFDEQVAGVRKQAVAPWPPTVIPAPPAR